MLFFPICFKSLYNFEITALPWVWNFFWIERWKVCIESAPESIGAKGNRNLFLFSLRYYKVLPLLMRRDLILFSFFSSPVSLLLNQSLKIRHHYGFNSADLCIFPIYEISQAIESLLAGAQCRGSEQKLFSSLSSWHIRRASWNIQ